MNRIPQVQILGELKTPAGSPGSSAMVLELLGVLRQLVLSPMMRFSISGSGPPAAGSWPHPFLRLPT